MTFEEALEWINGGRSMCNLIPQEPFDTWTVRIAQADAAMVQAAYWILKAHKEKLLGPAPLVQALVRAAREALEVYGPDALESGIWLALAAALRAVEEAGKP